MKNRNVVGAVLALVAGLMGIVGHLVLFQKWYVIGMHAESAEPGCEILLKYIHPFLADLGVLAGVLFLVSAYGFLIKEKWAFTISVIGLVLALLASWFVNVPYMAAKLPPVYFPLFVPYLLLYFVFVQYIGGVSWRRTLIALVTGIAYILCWMEGVSSLSRIFTIGAPIFVFSQRLNWLAMVIWAVITVGLILQPRPWMRTAGLIAAVTELVAGTPLAIVTTMQLGRFSLFAPAPIMSLILLIVLLTPKWWDRWSETEASTSTAG